MQKDNLSANHQLKRRLFDALFVDDIPVHYRIKPHVENDTLILSVRNGEDCLEYDLHDEEIDYIVMQTLPSIVNGLDIVFTAKHFNSARYQLVKYLKDEALTCRQALTPKPTKPYDSISGAFFKRGKWVNFVIAISAQTDLPVIRFSKRGAGTFSRQINEGQFKDVFQQTFSRACQGMEICEHSDTVRFLKLGLYQHLHEQYIALTTSTE